MGHYSTVYFGYNTEVAAQVEKLFRKTFPKSPIPKPTDFFDEEFYGHYHSSYQANRKQPDWIILSTSNTKWYDSYEPEGKINRIMEHMRDNPDEYPPDEWFWIRIGEQFPSNLQDFVYYGSTAESPYEWTVSLTEFEGSGGAGVRWSDQESFDNEVEPYPPYSFGTINYAYVSEWVDMNEAEDRIIPDDEIWD